MLLSKNKMHQCQTFCCHPCSSCLVSSHNAIYSSLDRSRARCTMRPNNGCEIDYAHCRSFNREKIKNYSSIISCLKNIIPRNFTTKSKLKLCFDLIYHSTDYDKQGLAAYQSFEDYRLFDDGYVKSLLTPHLNSRGNSCIWRQCAPFYESKNGRGKGTLRSLICC